MTADARFAGRHALVTGAGTGIGRHAAIALAAEGASVTLVGRTPQLLEEAAAAASAAARGASGVAIRTVPADVRDEDEITRAFSPSGEGDDPVDLLVAAAGINRPGPLVEARPESLREMLDINVLGTLLTCRAFAQQLLPTGRPGAVVCISSQMGAVGFPGRAPYCATKHAVNGLTKALALEWATSGIRVNAVAPTFIRTPLTEPMLADADFRAQVESRIPLGRVGRLDEVSAAVTFLLSDAASLITGHVLAADGGWTAI